MRTLSVTVVLAVLGTGFSFLRASEGFDELSNRAKSGASEEVLAAFVEKSTVAYELSVDEIFFLSDLGYSSKMIADIVEHGKSIRAGKKPADWTPEQLVAFAPEFTAEMAKLFVPAEGMRTRVVPGGTAPSSVAAALDLATQRFERLLKP